MVIIDTSAWIEYFRDGNKKTVDKVDFCLENDFAGVGDLIYCEIIQGIKDARSRKKLSSFLLALPQYDLCGFHIAEKAAFNYRLLRSKGITIRKTIDVIIATFCIENDFELIHFDRDFNAMQTHLDLKAFKIK